MPQKIIITPVPIENPIPPIPERLLGWNLFNLFYGEENYVGNILVPKKVDFLEIIRVYDQWQSGKSLNEKPFRKDQIYIACIEERIFPRKGNYFASWRHFRLEYGGTHQNCIYAGAIRVPPNITNSDIRETLRRWQD